MLARRFRELAGLWNRSDLVDRAISEYKQALDADPDSLFLRVELAELYWRARRVGDAVREAEAVLKVDPDYEDAHRLLARLYWHNLGEANQPDRVARESLHKAIEHLEAVTRLKPSDTESWEGLGRLYKLDNQAGKAEGAFKKALAVEPNSKSALADLAQLYFDQGDYEHAIDLLKKIPESDMDPPMLGMLAFAYGRARDFDNAIAAYQKALASEHENPELRRAYAETLMNAGKLAVARQQLELILQADPEDGSTHLRLAQLDRQEGQFEQARRELERAKTLLPDNQEVSFEQAQVEEAVGNQDQAVEILQGLVKLSERPGGQYTAGEANNHAIFLEHLGMIYRSQEKYDQAVAVFRQVVALGTAQGPAGERLIVETLRQSGQRQKALDEAQAAIRKYPDDHLLRVLQATMLAEQGHVAEGTKQLQALLNGTPADREIYLPLAQVYSQAKQYGEAEAAANKALSLSPKPEDQEYALFVLGSVLEREKKYDQAEQQFKKVLAVNPLNAAAANYLGYMLADRGVRLEESVRYIKEALKLEPNNGAYLDSLGWAYFKMSRYDLAEAPLERAAQLISNDPTIHQHLGHLYLQMGKKGLAAEEWERALKEWPHAVASDFDAEQAVRLRKQLDELRLNSAKEREKTPNQRN
jgi:tetratricopeptide (TPR) repeat protein